jgi:hypothetical protein
VILLALALVTMLNIDPGNAMAINVQCGQWERINETHYRAEAGADVLFDTGDAAKWHHFDGAVDATEEHAPDLTDTLEAFCHVQLFDGDAAQ